MWELIKKWIPALKSRKVRVSIVTFVVATAARLGFDLDAELVYAIVVLGVAVIGGIAIEDHGTKSKSEVKVVAGRSATESIAGASKTGENGSNTG